MSKKHGFNTLALHAGARIDETNSRGVPLHRTSSYVFNSTSHAADLFALKEPGNIYTRLMNPTHEVLEERMTVLEGGAGALALASGTAAVFYAVINICGQGDEVASANNLYGGTYTMFDSILPEFGIKTRFGNPLEPDNFEDVITEHTKMLFTEVIGNPVLDVANIKAVSEVAQKYHIPLVVDSTFTTPYLFRPLEHGADVVVHSLTKWLGGHGTGIGGVVVDSGGFDWTDRKFRLFNEPDESYHGLRYAHDLGDLNPLAFITRMRLVPLRNLGACISPDNAWMFLQGIETLPLRMQRHCDNAMATAQYLTDHPAVNWVRYPGLPQDPAHEAASRQFENGFGGMVVFGVKGGREAGETFINKLALISHLANVGDAKSLAIHPASTTHSQLSEVQQREGGITPDLIRLSVGIESIEDIHGDLGQALASIR
ncbi:MAG: O-acetylhomoserine aminocarboxypropyltransferase/cysteine synthase [Deltaproteobacteria bacterium]|nr:O-acetylhomoserine aminocarboxypropyltransferase/cysteine synthase [Deltaproteobacteria bacterium]